MIPRPRTESLHYIPSGKLRGKTAIVTGGDSGIGRAISILYAKEGADVSIVYLNEHEDAEDTKKMVEREGRRCLLLSGDVGSEDFCRKVVSETVDAFGKVDILVNNAGEQHVQFSIEDITEEQLVRTFRTNIFSFFFMTKASLKYMKPGSVVINTTSVTAYKGSAKLLDYSATKGAIVAFTRSLSQSLLKKGIRVNAVAPGPVWTPLVASTFPRDQIEKFGSDYPMKRPAQPEEIAPSYVFLASTDSSFMAGQVLHPNGGKVVSG
jgi:NAD(P)-dependent dehydrogenase (short-subunit alcohol dehydrogenase family)